MDNRIDMVRVVRHITGSSDGRFTSRNVARSLRIPMTRVNAIFHILREKGIVILESEKVPGGKGSVMPENYDRHARWVVQKRAV